MGKAREPRWLKAAGKLPAGPSPRAPKMRRPLSRGLTRARPALRAERDRRRPKEIGPTRAATAPPRPRRAAPHGACAARSPRPARSRGERSAQARRPVRERGRRWAGPCAGTVRVAEGGRGAILNWLRGGGGGCTTRLRVPREKQGEESEGPTWRRIGI